MYLEWIVLFTTAAARPHTPMTPFIHVPEQDIRLPNPLRPLPDSTKPIWNSTFTHNKAPSSFPDRSFGGTCRKVTLGGSGKIGMATLQGECADGQGQWWETSLNLNECIGSFGGNLIYQDGGNFDSSCRPCILDVEGERDDVVLKCNCLNRERLPQYTSLRIGSQDDVLTVRPVDGVFVCGEHQGIGSPTFGEVGGGNDMWKKT